MPLHLIISPFSLDGISTKITFKTTHAQPGRSAVTMTSIVETPEITQPEEKIKGTMLTIVDSIIENESSVYFLRPVDAEIDHAPNYYEVIKNPKDLSGIRKLILNGSYSSFKDFVEDLKTLILNATKFNPLSHTVHQAALKISALLHDLIVKLNANPEEFLKNPNERSAENKIGKAMAKLQELKKERQRARRTIETKKTSVKPTNTPIKTEDYERIAENIKRLPSSALIGVLEIITKGNFKIEDLPINFDLKGIDATTYHKLKKYVDSCIGDLSKGARTETPTLYAWRPFEPDDLTTIRETYAAELQSWKAPPPDDAPANTE